MNISYRSFDGGILWLVEIISPQLDCISTLANLLCAWVSSGGDGGGIGGIFRLIVIL
jgi:hypothetical protein